MLANKKNIVLIGMPGAGKSTVGVVLAKRLGMRFVDSDLVIQERTQRLLQQILMENGLQEFIRIEDEVNESLILVNTVLATGGSAVYGLNAMQSLKDQGTVIYLKLPFETIEHRVGDLRGRGVAMKPGQTLKELYDERTPLYERYADIVCPCEDKEIREIVDMIAKSLELV